MIILESEKSESTVYSTHSQSSPATSDVPGSPPPYTPTIASSSDHHQTSGHLPAGFEIPSGSLPNLNAPPEPHPSLPPQCNHLIERKLNSSVSGTWHVDTALEIPESLLPPITEFDGSWNQDIQKARKEREKALRKRRDQSLPSLPPLIEVRPNLMLTTTNGAINSQVHVISSDGAMRQTTIVAQGCNGSINLKVHASPEQPMRIYATSTNGSVNVRIPSSFEGAIVMSTSWGSVKISDSIKAKLTTFSATFNTSRCFIGNWQAMGFRTSLDTPNPNDDPPLPTIQPVSPDAFTSWPGPVVHLSTTNGSVSLSFNEEDTEDTFSGGLSHAVWKFVGGFFGGGKAGAVDANRGSPAANGAGSGSLTGSSFWSQAPKPPIFNAARALD